MHRRLLCTTRKVITQVLLAVLCSLGYHAHLYCACHLFRLLELVCIEDVAVDLDPACLLLSSLLDGCLDLAVVNAV